MWVFIPFIKHVYKLIRVGIHDQYQLTINYIDHPHDGPMLESLKEKPEFPVVIFAVHKRSSYKHSSYGLKAAWVTNQHVYIRFPFSTLVAHIHIMLLFV